ncbi:unnamed protein product [Sphagnum balticum]
MFGLAERKPNAFFSCFCKPAFASSSMMAWICAFASGVIVSSKGIYFSIQSSGMGSVFPFFIWDTERLRLARSSASPAETVFCGTREIVPSFFFSTKKDSTPSLISEGRVILPLSSTVTFLAVSMGYFIKRLPFRKSAPSWKVQFVSYKKADIRPECRAKKPKREWDIRRERWQVLGFSTFMTIEESRARARQLNAQAHLKRQEEQILKNAEAKAISQCRYDATMPSEFVAKFENRFVRKRDSQTDQGVRRTSERLLPGDQLNE